MDSPILIKGFIKTSFVDWPGRVCSVIFLGGCSFRCPACHNAHLVLNPDELPNLDLAEPLAYLRTRRNWIDGVTITGGEPTIHRDIELLIDRVRSLAIPVKLDTNGSRPDVLRRLLGRNLLDAVFMDVKAPLSFENYSRAAGVGVDVNRIRESMRILDASGIEVVYRTTAVPGLVEERELEDIRRSLNPAGRFIIQGFRARDTLDPQLRELPEFPPDRLELMQRRYEFRSDRWAPLWSSTSAGPH
jgi:pyruvate formate lyase activating enzyme